MLLRFIFCFYILFSLDEFFLILFITPVYNFFIKNIVQGFLMYNEFAPKHYKGKCPCTTKTLYNEKTLTGRLHKYFLIYFETFSAPTADTLFLLVLSILTLESVHSIRFLYQHFLSGITTKSLNTFYHACSYA